LFDLDELSFRLDDLIMVAVNSIEPQSFAIDSENDLAKVYNIPHFNIRNSAQSVFDYLLRLNGQCNSLVKQVGSTKKFICDFQSYRIVLVFSIYCRNVSKYNFCFSYVAFSVQSEYRGFYRLDIGYAYTSVKFDWEWECTNKPDQINNFYSLTEKDVSIVFTKFLLTNPFNCEAVLRDLVLSSKNEQLTDSESCSEVSSLDN
jgi:hypothetical protein